MPRLIVTVELSHPAYTPYDPDDRGEGRYSTGAASSMLARMADDIHGMIVLQVGDSGYKVDGMNVGSGKWEVIDS